MEIYKLLLERLLGWPVMTLLALLLFRKPVAALLNRVHTVKAGKEGFTLDASIIAATIQTGTKVEVGLRPTEAEQRLKEVENVAVPVIVQEQEKFIRADLQKMELDVDSQTVNLLVRHLAMTQLVAAAEQIYRTIFGSQIALLKHLNTVGHVPIAHISALYEAAKSRFPDLYATYTLPQYLNYLVTQRLIGTDDQQNYYITIRGGEFLKWMTTARVTENKPF